MDIAGSLLGIDSMVSILPAADLPICAKVARNDYISLLYCTGESIINI
jgi:hypothetical protein